MRFLVPLVPLLFLGLAASCGTAPAEPKAEHEARKLSPIPACAVVLPSHDPGQAQAVLFSEYWKLVFPAFDDSVFELPADALSCTGSAVLRGEVFLGVDRIIPVTDNEITVGGGSDGIRAVWLRSHSGGETLAAGAVALVRVQDGFAYVIAVGAYRGRPDARLSLDRLGSELVLLVRDDGCKQRQPDESCQSWLTVFLVRQGRLAQGARVVIEQVAHGDGVTLGDKGQVFHLTASPSFLRDEMHLAEHVRVLDQFGRTTRRAELERVFMVVGDMLDSNGESLWSRTVQPSQGNP